MVIKLQMFKNVWLVLWVKDTVWWERSSIGYQWRVRTGRAQLEQETGNTHTRTPARQDLNFKKDPDTFGRASTGARLSTGAHLKQQGWMTESQRFSIHKTRAVWDTQSERASETEDWHTARQTESERYSRIPSTLPIGALTTYCRQDFMTRNPSYASLRPSVSICDPYRDVRNTSKVLVPLQIVLG